MFTIQYQAVDGQSRLQELDTCARRRLVTYLSKFDHPILAVYEQTTPITKAVWKELASMPIDKLSRCAAEFVRSPP